MDARSLYRAAKSRKGVVGVLLRLLVFVYVRGRPRWLGRRRLQFTDAIVYVVARKPGPVTPAVADGD